MKKQNLLIGILIGLFFFSCSSDDDNQDDTSTSIIGTWNLIERNGNSNITCPLTLVVAESQITENEHYGTDCTELDSITNTYSYDGNTFTIQTDIGDFVFTIISLTESQLEWETTDPDTNNVTNLKYNRIE